MAVRRVIYALVLTGVLLFQITNENYLARFLLVLCAALPLLSLALSLPGMLGCRLTLASSPPALDRGGEGRWLICVESPSALPLARLVLHLSEENLFTGDRSRRRLTLDGVARRRPVEVLVPAPHCGLLELRADRIRVYDCLGLFVLPVPRPKSSRLLCRPVPLPAEPPVLPEGRGSRPSPDRAARLGPGEDYDLRDYRPGDPMRSVHWKLSSKWDQLIVRERAETLVPLPLLTLDLCGPPDTLDPLLDRLLGLSQAMLRSQQPHGVLWLDREGAPQLHVISDWKEQEACLLALLGAPAPLSGPRLDGCPELLRTVDGPVFRIHIAPEKGGDGHG